MPVNKKNFLFGLILAASLVARVIVLHYSWKIPPLYDEGLYLGMAREITEKGYFAGAFKPPLYPYFLAGLLKLFCGSIYAVKLAQVIVGTLSTILVYKISKTIFNSENVALTAAAIFSLYPDMVWYSCFLWDETFFIFLFLLCFYLLLRFQKESKWYLLFAAGLLVGLSALTKSVMLYFPVFVLAWLIKYHRKEGLRLTAVFMAGAIIAISPCTIKNYMEFKRFVPINTDSMLNFYEGNNDIFGYEVDFGGKRKEMMEKYRSLGENGAEREKGALKDALHFIWREQPQWFFKKLYYQLPDLWNPDSLALRHIRMGKYGEVPPYLVKAEVVIFILAYFSLIFTAIFGFIYAPKAPSYWLIICFFIYLNLVYVVAHASTRYDLPMMPFLMLYSAYILNANRCSDEIVFTLRKNVLGVSASALFVIIAFISNEWGFLVNMLTGKIYASY